MRGTTIIALGLRINHDDGTMKGYITTILSQDRLGTILNGQDVVVFAPRLYGKSSLVWRVAQELIKDDVLVAQVDLMRTPTKDQLAAKLARTIHEDLASRLWNAKERLKVFAGLRIRPLEQTVADTLAWARSEEGSALEPPAGLDRAKERLVLDAWLSKE